jgi:hypothetical protein
VGIHGVGNPFLGSAVVKVVWLTDVRVTLKKKTA